MSYKDFDAAKAKLLSDRPVFKLGGRTFMCKPQLHYRTMMRFSSGLTFDYSSPELSAQTDAGLQDFFKAVLVKKDREPFFALLSSEPDDDNDQEEESDLPFDFTDLIGIFEWLVARYTGRPTQSSEQSSPGPSSTGEPSKDGSSAAPAVA